MADAENTTNVKHAWVFVADKIALFIHRYMQKMYKKKSIYITGFRNFLGPYIYMRVKMNVVILSLFDGDWTLLALGMSKSRIHH